MSHHTEKRLMIVGRFSEDIATTGPDGKPVRKIAYCHDSNDARRLVACWNFCVGLSTEAIEGAPVAHDAIHRAMNRPPPDTPGGG